MADACLVTVAVGEAYETYAGQLLDSASDRFRPAERVELVSLPGVEGWPAATLYRYHVVLEHADRLDADYLYLCDADMRFEATVGPEVLGGLVATRHPGYVAAAPERLPYERRRGFAARVLPGEGGVYYAGGFVGGERDRFLDLALRIVHGIGMDADRGAVAVWHDESHLNRRLIDTPPDVVLSPSYCYPDEDAWYRSVWPEPYERKLVALDKSPQERGSR